MTKRRLVKYMFDSISVLLAVFGVMGSLGAWESRTIGAGRMAAQLVLSLCLLYLTAMLRARALSKLRRAPRRAHAAVRVYPLEQTA